MSAKTLVRSGVALALVAGGFALPGVGATAALEVRTKIRIEVRPLTAQLVSERDALFATLVVDPTEPAETSLRLAWPDPGSVSTLGLRAVQVPPSAGAENAVTLDAQLVLPDRTTVHAARTVTLDDHATALFEVYRLGDRSLTLALELEATRETVVAAARAPGSQVRFRVEVVRVISGRQVSLENNYLNTLVGEPVSYSFRLADTADADAVSLTLKPTRLHADIAEIDVDVSGKLPLGGELVVIGRTEHWLASRDATSTLAFESGEPPSGYRFLVTARF